MLRAVFFATRLEAAHVLADKSFGYEQICAEPFRVWRNGKNLIVVTGIGLVNASLGFAWAADKFGFSDALNIGAAGATIADETAEPDPSIMGKVCSISQVVCLEPYNELSFDIAPCGERLVTSSRPVETRADRIAARGIFSAGVEKAAIDARAVRARYVRSKRIAHKQAIFLFCAEPRKQPPKELRRRFDGAKRFRYEQIVEQPGKRLRPPDLYRRQSVGGNRNGVAAASELRQRFRGAVHKVSARFQLL